MDITNRHLSLDEILDNKMIKEEFFESCDGTIPKFPGQEEAAGGCNKMMSADWVVKEEEVGGNLMKEEIKEEDLEDEKFLIDENKVNLDFHCENLAAHATKQGVQNYLQEKIESPLSNAMEASLFPFNSKLVICDKSLQLQKKRSSVDNSFKYSSRAHQRAKKRNLKCYKRSQTGEKPSKRSSCPYKVAQRSHLVTHEKIHMGEKPFKCDFCSYETTKRSNLQRHERTHTSEKPFKCSSCHYETTERSTLRKHERTHTGEKPFKCSFCPYEAAQRSTICAHERIHTGEKPFKCSSCSYEAANKSNVQRHEKTHTLKNLSNTVPATL